MDGTEAVQSTCDEMEESGHSHTNVIDLAFSARCEGNSVSAAGSFTGMNSEIEKVNFWSSSS
jgi:hypothetical protein